MGLYAKRHIMCLYTIIHTIWSKCGCLFCFQCMFLLLFIVICMSTLYYESWYVVILWGGCWWFSLLLDAYRSIGIIWPLCSFFISVFSAGFPKQTAAQIILASIRDYFSSAKSSNLKQIFFVLYDAESVNVYTTELARLDGWTLIFNQHPCWISLCLDHTIHSVRWQNISVQF